MRSKFSLQYISDIHLEKINIIPYKQLNPISNNIALLGDIGNPFTQVYKDLLKHVSTNFDNVFLISGNHEYYFNSILNTNNQISEVANSFNNVHFLNNTSISVNNYNIIGSTLWSNLLPHPKNDKLDVYTFLHMDAINNIQSLLSNKPTIILTHYLPTYKLIHPKYYYYPMHIRSRYASDLEYMMNDNIHAWLTGHSHKNVDVYINNTFCSINPLPDYNNRIIEL